MVIDEGGRPGRHADRLKSQRIGTHTENQLNLVA
jgi:hypothetical protein